MREILFRGKKHNGEWYYGSYLFLNVPARDWKGDSRGKAEPVHYIVNEKDINYAVDPETVGQCTGLKDKNGKKIFEGDFVVCKQEISGNFVDCCVEIGFVEMKYGAFGLHRKQGYYRPFKDWLEDYEYEVIGNIHDNPELLEVTDNA